MVRRSGRPTAALGVFAVSLLCVAGVVGAQQKPTVKRVPAQPIKSLEGKDTFKEYCAVCHGTDAKGNGPAAKALKKPPADLTKIVARRGGRPFPTVEIRDIILGQEELESHGTREMPMWGPVFRSFQSSPDDQTTQIRMVNLLDYLKSIQEK